MTGKTDRQNNEKSWNLFHDVFKLLLLQHNIYMYNMHLHLFLHKPIRHSYKPYIQHSHRKPTACVPDMAIFSGAQETQKINCDGEGATLVIVLIVVRAYKPSRR